MDSKNWLNTFKSLSIFIYFFVTPYLLAPNWCVNHNRGDPSHYGPWGTVNCDVAAQELGIAYSGIVAFKPMYTGGLDFLCIGFLLFHRIYKQKYMNKVSFRSRLRTILIFLFGLISIVSTVICVLKHKFPVVVNFCRPVILLLYFTGLRRSVKSILLSLYDTMVILISMSAFIVIYCLVGYSLFRSGPQGQTVFTSMNSTMYQMFILMTTANFPDVMLAAYDVSFWNSIYFVTYLMLGLYLLMNLLLANVFSVYQRRLAISTEERV